jgi:hypothetical protein
MTNSLCFCAPIFPLQSALFSGPTPVPVRPYSQHYTGDGQNNGNTRHIGLKLYVLAALKEH